MLTPLVRAYKGLTMTVMFGLFFLGMMFHLLLVMPVSWFLEKLFGKKRRVENAVRTGFKWWLGLLGIAGLLKASPSAGRRPDMPCVIVCNHPGLFDVLYLIKEIPNLAVMVKYSLPRSLPLGPLLRELGYILVPDYDRISPLDTAEEAVARLERGGKIQLFPEGTRSPRGGLLPFKAGAFKIARIANVPVQPVIMRHDPPFLTKDEKWFFPLPKTSRIRLEFLEPLPPPVKGEERQFARDLEESYRKTLGLGPG